MDIQRSTSRMTRIVTQGILFVILGTLLVLSFTMPQSYQFWFLCAGYLIAGILLVFGGLFFDSSFAEAIGIRNKSSRSRRFHIIYGFLFIALAVATFLLNHR